MPTHGLTALALVLATAVALGLLMNRMRLPAAAGFILVGVALGPSGMGLVATSDSIDTLAELGVLMLLFIIGMEMRHVREVLVVDPGAISRAFTLPDLVKRAEAVGPRTDPDVRRWIEELAAGRKRLDLLKKDHGLEVPDPIGGSKRKFRRTAESLGDLVDRFVELTWPQAPPSGHHGGVSETSAPIPGST
jgi:protein-tyrosine-phosphatase